MATKAVEFYKKYCRLFGGLFKSQASDELKFAVDFLEWKLKPEHIVGAGKFTMFLGFFIIILLSTISLFFGINPVSYIFISPLAIVLFFAVTEWPKSLAKQMANKSLSSAPYIMTQLAVSLKQTPNMENAISFISQNSTGKISRELRDILFHAWSGKVRSVYPEVLKLADRWSKFSVGFQRALHLIISSFHEKTKKSKERTLDLAVSTMLSDITTSMHSYAVSLHIPTLVLFSIGTIFPLMIISLFPIVSFFGMQVSQMTVAGFLAFSLIASYLYSNMALRKRPVGFALPKVTAKSNERMKPIAAAIATILTIPTLLFFAKQAGIQTKPMPDFLIDVIGPYGMIWGIGLGLSIYLYSTSAAKKKERQKTKELENQFADSLYHIKNRLKDGQPLESAFEFSANMLQNISVGKYLSRILDIMHTRNITLEQALKKEKTGSIVINSVFNLMLSAMKKGRMAVVQTSEVIYIYLSRIKKIEKNVNTMLSKTLSMIKATIMFFAPIVCAIIIVLFQMINKTIKNVASSDQGYGMGGLFVAPSVTPEILQIIVGLYLIVLNYVLMRYVSYVQTGFDKTSLHYDLSRSLPITLLIFTATLIVSKMLLL